MNEETMNRVLANQQKFVSSFDRDYAEPEIVRNPERLWKGVSGNIINSASAVLVVAFLAGCAGLFTQPESWREIVEYKGMYVLVIHAEEPHNECFRIGKRGYNGGCHGREVDFGTPIAVVPYPDNPRYDCILNRELSYLSGSTEVKKCN